MGHFEKREWSDNTWKPNVCGVDFSERLRKFMGDVALDGTEVYTAWLITDEGGEIQITPDSCRAFISLTDDESDMITVLDPTDSLWFQFMRATHGESFDQALELVTPWAQTTTGLVPTPQVYGKFLEVTTNDMQGEMFIPDEWTIDPT